MVILNANAQSECAKRMSRAKVQSKFAKQVCRSMCGAKVQRKCAKQMCRAMGRAKCEAVRRANVQRTCAEQCAGQCAEQCARQICIANAQSKCAAWPGLLVHRDQCASAGADYTNPPIRVVPIRSMPSRSVSIRAVPIRAVRSYRVQTAPICAAAASSKCFVCTSSSRDHCRLVIVCRPRPYVRLQLRRSARSHFLVARLLSPRDRMQSAPVCGCSFVEVASTSGAVARAAAARCAASRTCDLLHARSRGLCSSCACSAGVGRRLLASNLCSASTASRMRRLCLHDIRAIGNQPFVFVSSASCAVRARVRLQLRRSARPHSLVARLCRLVISFVSYAVRARVRLRLRRSARPHPFVARLS